MEMEKTESRKIQMKNKTKQNLGKNKMGPKNVFFIYLLFFKLNKLMLNSILSKFHDFSSLDMLFN